MEVMAVLDMLKCSRTLWNRAELCRLDGNEGLSDMIKPAMAEFCYICMHHHQQ